MISCYAQTMTLTEFGNVVPPGYAYYPKLISPRARLVCPNAILKWYDIHPADREISEAERAEACRHVEAEALRLGFQQELGFVLFHHTASALLLMVCTWRNTNEIWESVYFKPIDSAQGYALQPFDATHRGTFCVWELAAVWHERNAWTQFLSSPRDEAAKQAYLDLQVVGEF